MAPVARELSSSFRVIEPLQRRSGDVPVTVGQHVEDLREVIAGQHKSAILPALVGSSWGAQLALAFAAAYPELAGPIVLVGSGTYDPVARREFHRILDERLRPSAGAPGRSTSPAGDPDVALAAEADALTLPYSYDVLTTDLEMEWVDARGNRETTGDWHRLEAEGRYPASFRSIISPVFMIHGDTDPHPGRMIRDSLLPFLPQLEYVELERCGHYPWIERHAREPFLAVLVAWLARHMPAA
jgi:pimeloyl-ACP methyl ester carboxylesterase